MKKILVIDDDLEICKLVQKALSKEGYEVTVRNNVVGLIESELNQYHLILLCLK